MIGGKSILYNWEGQRHAQDNINTNFNNNTLSKYFI